MHRCVAILFPRPKNRQAIAKAAHVTCGLRYTWYHHRIWYNNNISRSMLMAIAFMIFGTDHLPIEYSVSPFTDPKMDTRKNKDSAENRTKWRIRDAKSSIGLNIVARVMWFRKRLYDIQSHSEDTTLYRYQRLTTGQCWLLSYMAEIFIRNVYLIEARLKSRSMSLTWLMCDNHWEHWRKKYGNDRSNRPEVLSIMTL